MKKSPSNTTCNCLKQVPTPAKELKKLLKQFREMSSPVWKRTRQQKMEELLEVQLVDHKAQIIREEDQ